MKLYNKMEEIKQKGSGFMPPKEPKHTMKSQLSGRSSSSKFRGPNEHKLLEQRSLHSSKNFNFMKAEAQRIDRDNFEMAKRMLVNPGAI